MRAAPVARLLALALAMAQQRYDAAQDPAIDG
jgi:hypothetical protein